MTDASKKAKKSERRAAQLARYDWERLNFELAALRTVKSMAAPAVYEAKINPRLTDLEREFQETIKKRKGKTGIFVQLGQKTVLMFLQSPQYIPLMKREMALRAEARRNKEDMLGKTLDNPFLRAVAEENAATIHPGGLCLWNRHYLQVQSNYIETMGRACSAAEMALRRIAPDPQSQQQAEPVQQKPQTVPSHEDRPDIPTPRVKAAPYFVRPSEEEVNLWLNNKCDDNVPGDDTEADTPASVTKKDPAQAPRKIKQQKYYQPTLFDLSRDRS